MSISMSVPKMNSLAIFVLFVVQQASGVIYRLNDTEYRRLPPLFQLDEFYPCLQQQGDYYCYVDAKLVANTTSELLTFIQDYSSNNITHYDHTIVHRGLCVTQTCRDYNSSDLAQSLEACLNDTLYRTHRLQAKLIKDKVYCTQFEERIEIDTGDYVVAVVVAFLLILNVVGSLYDFCCNSYSDNIGTKLLLCFSVKKNWQRLVAPSGEGPEPKLRRLKSFNGLKTITTALVIFGHSPLVTLLTTNNPEFIESIYHNPSLTIMLNGSLIVQSFFLMSGFLLAYNMLIGGKRRTGWEMLPKGVLLRWLRLTPPYALVLAFVSTWLRHLGNGPFWKSVVGAEVVDCRREWYLNLLYLNNYVDNYQCMAHTWYLAAEMQLTILGLVIFCLLTSPRARKLAVAAMIAVGLVTPALHTYLQNLHAVILVTPEVAINYFVQDPTFNNLYKRGHTNIVCYALGLALGMVIYTLQEKNFDIVKYKKIQKYRSLYWCSFPLAVLLMMAGHVFYMDGIHIPLVIRAVYSSAVKIIYGLLLCVFISGTIFKMDNVYRGVIEWRGWASLGRISYCAYLVHVCVVRTAAANNTTLVHSSIYQMALNYLGILVLSFMLAAPCWMLVEAPVAQLVKVCLNPGSRSQKKKNVTMAAQVVVIGIKETLDVKL